MKEEQWLVGFECEMSNSLKGVASKSDLLIRRDMEERRRRVSTVGKKGRAVKRKLNSDSEMSLHSSIVKIICGVAVRTNWRGLIG